MGYRQAQAQINQIQLQNQKKILAMKYGVKPSEITKEDVENYQNETTKEGVKQMAGVGSVSGAGLLANKTKDKGYLSGRRTVYHTTEKKNVSSIKEHGLKPFGKNDVEAGFTNRALAAQRQLGFINSDADKPAVYVGKDKSVIKGIIGGKKAQSKDSFGQIPFEEQEILKAKIPYDKYKKMKTIENPELLGAKNAKEFGDKRVELDRKIKENNKKNGYYRLKLNEPSEEQIRREAEAGYRKFLGPKKTKVFTESISPEHIVGSKKYIKNSPKEVLNYIKHNPKRFAKGLGIYGLVGAGATVGGKAIIDAQKEANKLKTLEGLRNKAKKDKQKKEAFEYIDELYMEKVASLGDSLKK